MHVSPSELRTVRRDGLLLRFTVFDSVTYVLAELPDTGTPGTGLEEWCEQPHWGIVLRGELTLERGDQRTALPAGRVFHVAAGGPPHSFRGDRRAVIAGFAPLPDRVDMSDEAIAAQGFDVIHDTHQGGRDVPRAAGDLELPGGPRSRSVGRVDVQAVRMGPWLCCQARFRGTTGFEADWCDLPHWGLVLRGELALDSEDEAELVSAGDVYFCPAGPPGHRFEAADEALIMDFTPLDSFGQGARISGWRPRARVLETAL